MMYRKTKEEEEEEEKENMCTEKQSGKQTPNNLLLSGEIYFSEFASSKGLSYVEIIQRPVQGSLLGFIDAISGGSAILCDLRQRNPEIHQFSLISQGFLVKCE